MSVPSSGMKLCAAGGEGGANERWKGSKGRVFVERLEMHLDPVMSILFIAKWLFVSIVWFLLRAK